MNLILSKMVDNKVVILVSLQSGGYQIKSGNLTQTFRKTPFDLVLDFYRNY